ncbi:TonB C-terminal domain-containing protein [Rhodomicrobium sp. Az07]|uniref:energy transducer TonB n=1 Tax=Rhodomicrobium sp. Az07 TaxID=2839034 RepID=UPI001BE94053|nr:energy transducer TonB [Rhodomicrobium sp. Az07]MBT3071784.1 TonB C-terminal domain-containing protein [Rhodomicrobium sp. Az07]
MTGAPDLDTNAIQSGAGFDDLTIVATISLDDVESIGPDAVNIEQSAASAGSEQSPPPEPEPVQEAEKIEVPQEEAEVTLPTKEEEKPEKPQERAPSTPAPSSAAQDEARASTRAYEARLAQLLAAYNQKVHQALMRNAARPKNRERGRVLLELTIAPTGELLSHRVVKSSGARDLDETAMASLKRAAPFPPIPADIAKGPRTLLVPFDYSSN